MSHFIALCPSCDNRLAQRYRRRLLGAVCTIQAFVRKYKLRGQWLRLRRGLRTFHSLARGFIVRQHVIKMMAAVGTIQAAARRFLRRNELYWSEVRAALLFQARVLLFPPVSVSASQCWDDALGS